MPLNWCGLGYPLSSYFGGVYKYEEIYLHDYATPREARRAIAAYIAFYNHERRHQSLDYATPVSVYGVPSPIRTTSSRRPD